MDRQFAGAGTGNQIACAEEVEKLFAGEPFPAADQLIFHDGDMRRRSAKCGDPQAQEEKRQFSQRSALCPVQCFCLDLLEVDPSWAWSRRKCSSFHTAK